MINLNYGILLSDEFTLAEKFNLMKCPNHYVADTVKDFTETKSKLRSPIRHMVIDPVMPDYAVIMLFDVNLRWVKNKEGECLISFNELEQPSMIFEVEDRTGKQEILWSYEPHTKTDFKNAHSNQGLMPDDFVYTLTLVYDITHQNPFVYDVKKHGSLGRGRRTKKRNIESLIKELLPSLNPVPQQI